MFLNGVAATRVPTNTRLIASDGRESIATQSIARALR
jgi:hypothetical protein